MTKPSPFTLKSDSRLILSACLLGVPCRYDGRQKSHPESVELVRTACQAGIEIVAVCPEVLGGLSVPRPGAQLFGGDGHAVLLGRAQVLTLRPSRDVTEAFVRGAQEAFSMAQGAQLVLLKARSPSCGWGLTEIDLELRAGDGVFAALLRQAGIYALTDEALAADPTRVEIR